ncbi:hypothetical protein BDZ91DRAFT_646886, partial [Kalaharituber pfeilii]
QEVTVQEEQEREVANEVERQPEVQRPSRATPHTHELHPGVLKFIETGIVPLSRVASKSPFKSLMDILSQTSFHKSIEQGPWAANIITTADFARTITLRPGQTDATDNYLRPVTWIASSIRIPDTSPVLCLLSPFEVNELLPHIQRSKFVNLHMYTPKAQRQSPTFEDLTYASIPPLPGNWVDSFPSRDCLMDQVNLYAGQLFFKSHMAYQRTCGFLGI